jgi:hypothetical protein
MEVEEGPPMEVDYAAMDAHYAAKFDEEVMTMSNREKTKLLLDLLGLRQRQSRGEVDHDGR